jgi:hypothetical protein
MQDVFLAPYAVSCKSSSTKVRGEGAFCGIVISGNITGRGNPLGSETSRLPHFLDNRLTLRKIRGTHFCRRVSIPRP